MSHFLGTTEHMVLLAILKVGEGAYGVAIQEALAAAGRVPSSGTLSTTLDRLEKKGLIRSTYEEGPAEPARLGRPRRVVGVTPKGLAELAATQDALFRLMGRPHEEKA